MAGFVGLLDRRFPGLVDVVALSGVFHVCVEVFVYQNERNELVGGLTSHSTVVQKGNQPFF